MRRCAFFRHFCFIRLNLLLFASYSYIITTKTIRTLVVVLFLFFGIFEFLVFKYFIILFRQNSNIFNINKSIHK